MSLKRTFSSLFALAALAVMAGYFGHMGTITNIKVERVLSKVGDDNVYNQEYYNLNLDDKMNIGYLPQEHYPVGKGSVIALLVAKRPKDIEEAQVALRSLAFLQGDEDPEHPAPVLIFNEGDLPTKAIEALVKSTNRPIGFPLVDFNSFPEGFDPSNEKSEFVVAGRDKWGYYQMIRFWVTRIWKQPAIQRFDAVMRLDSDSCFKEFNEYLPNFMYDGLYYHSQYVGVEPKHGVKFMNGMYDFVVNWMEKTQQPPQPRNALLWHYLKSVWETDETLPVFRTNFELSKRAFMQRGDIARFHEAVTEKDPFPLLRNRWGDAILRFLMVSVFENNDKIMTVRPTGYFHKHGCTAQEVDDALRTALGDEYEPWAPEKIDEVTETQPKAESASATEPEPAAKSQPETESVEYNNLIESVV